ncbi:unnamed protein product [Cyprideis torosa]|uniref:Metalloendopeptidase n=1 Tax=Cyprideis torosa TaxID=163714 RepID=A0A7R8WMS8_9CRUS|nr:unnamed protein product [Cyprideis torosa]CAG0903173.1 unnamed protein product [Cyprideis torosa]
MEAVVLLLIGFLLSHFCNAAPKRAGDIMLPPGTDRAAMNFNLRPEQKWPNGVVPYYIDNTFSSSESDFILYAMDQFEYYTCIRFVPWTEEYTYWIWITKTNACQSYIGRISESHGQYLELAAGCLQMLGIPIHELMHAIGFFHEHTRPDRDDYVTIHWDQIDTDLWYNFEKRSSSEVDSLGSPYDYSSVMHYGRYDFAKSSLPTITPKDPSATIGQREYFVWSDIIGINNLYNCDCNVYQC